jgi:hypothetical protein
MDVWTRSGSKYRVRAIVLLIANALLFTAVCAFAFWLRTGEPLAPALDSYADELWRALRLGGDTQVALGTLLIKPISVQDVPMMIPIMGLLMAALIAIPILVAILYRFWACVPFVLSVAFIALMPWLGMTLLLSCAVASLKPFRSSLRFMSALLGLLPAVVYLILAWQGTSDVMGSGFEPVDRIKFVAPWVLAIVASTIAFALVLTIAWLVQYRPGAIAPLLAVMFIAPVALFETRVGRDELHYRLLEDLSESHFRDQDASQDLRQAAEEAWFNHPAPRPPFEEIVAQTALQWQFALRADATPAASALAAHQLELAQQCDEFLRLFPQSRYACNVLYIKARALDMRVDQVEFRASRWIRFYDTFPSFASQQTWERVVTHCPESRLAGLARLRLAQLQARAGYGERALRLLEDLLAKWDPEGSGIPPLQAAPRESPSVFARRHPEASLQLPMERILLEAHRLRDLLRANEDPLYHRFAPIGHRDTRPYDSRPGLLDLEPRHPRYVENLRELATTWPKCQIEDNIDLEIAMAEKDPAARMRALELILDRYPRGDARPEALYHLAVTCEETGDPERCQHYANRLIKEFPGSIWARLAQRSLGGAGMLPG